MKSSLITMAMALAASAVASPAAVAEKRASSSSSNTPPITVKGNAFFRPDGTRFYIRGVDYQPGGASDPIDPLADADNCQRDIKQFQALGLNTIRIYTVDNTANHDQCMQMLSDAGIYLALDVNTGKYSINRATPGPSYNAQYLQSVFATVDAFAKYDNTLLFFSGNEVINAPDNTNTAPYIKAVTRDIKAYERSRGYRLIPVGYSAADVEENRYQTAAYMNCGSAETRSDFFAFNDYSWCDPNTFTGSGWSQKVQQYANYSIPLFLSEYGCNKNPPREFNEVSALYNSEMTSVYSGGLVYEYSNEKDNPNYGLVNIDSSSSVSPLTDFNNLMKQLKSSPSPTGDGGYNANGQPLACPTMSTNWQVDDTKGLPVFPSGAATYMKSGAGKGPGLSGSGSQNSGPANPAFANPSTSQAVDSASPTGSGSAAPATVSFETIPLAMALAVTVSTLFGASLL